MQITEQLRFQVQGRLDDFQRRRAAPDSGRRSAVVLLLIDSAFGPDLPGLQEHMHWDNGAALLLTRRSLQLRNHPGQWAFPGGRIDEGEQAVQAGLRELDEEAGIRLPETVVLGKLDDFITRSGFVMTPVVVWGGAGLEFTPNPEEVASIHRIPFTEFLRADAPILDKAPQGDAPILRMPVGADSIAAPTAAILYQFREVCLLGRDTRVAHYEQPEFAHR